MTPNPSARPIAPDSSAGARKAKVAYLAWWLAMPPIIVAVSFGALCAYECTSYPLLTLYIAPIVILLLATLSALVYWRFTASLPEPQKQSVRRYILSSVLWGPAAAAATVAALVLVSIFLF